MAKHQDAGMVLALTLALFGVVAVNAGAVTTITLATRNLLGFGVVAVALTAAAILVDVLAVRWLRGRRVVDRRVRR